MQRRLVVLCLPVKSRRSSDGGTKQHMARMINTTQNLSMSYCTSVDNTYMSAVCMLHKHHHETAVSSAAANDCYCRPLEKLLATAGRESPVNNTVGFMGSPTCRGGQALVRRQQSHGKRACPASRRQTDDAAGAATSYKTILTTCNG
jgi:hypothetical protein